MVRIKISLCFGVPDNHISLLFGVPNNQISLHCNVPGNQISLHLDVPENGSQAGTWQKFQLPKLRNTGAPSTNLRATTLLYIVYCKLNSVYFPHTIFPHSFPCKFITKFSSQFRFHGGAKRKQKINSFWPDTCGKKCNLQFLSKF